MAVLEIPIRGEITSATQKQVEEALSGSDAKEIHLIIDSPGGSVFAGYSIYNALKNSGKHVKSFIQGMCGSIATLISMAAKKEDIQGNKVGHYVIHNPATKAEGEEKDLRASAELLQKIKSVMVDKYAEYTGLKKEEISKMMDAESNFTIEEAATKGFIGKAVDEKIKAVAKISHQDVKSLNSKDKSLLEELKTMLAEIKEGFSSIGKKKDYAKNATALPAIAADGTEVVFYYEAPTPAVGIAVFTDEAMTVPAEDGDYTIEGGMLVVKDGMIAEMKPQEEMNKKIEDLEKKIAEAAAKEKELQEVKAKYETVEAKLKNYEKEIAKNQRDPVKADISMLSSEGGHYLDRRAEELKRKFNAN